MNGSSNEILPGSRKDIGLSNVFLLWKNTADHLKPVGSAVSSCMQKQILGISEQTSDTQEKRCKD